LRPDARSFRQISTRLDRGSPASGLRGRHNDPAGPLAPAAPRRVAGDSSFVQIRKSAPAWLAAPVSVILLLGVLVPALGPLGAAPPIHPAGSRAADAPPTPLFYSSAPDYPDAGLQGIVDSFVADAPGDWAVAIKKLDTGQYAEFNSHTQAETASLYKVFVLYEVMRQHALGKIDLDGTATITSENAAYDESIGELNWEIGARVKISTLIDRMITVSDNTAAITLAGLAGVDNINASLQRLGLRDSALNFSGNGDNMTTAADMSRLMEWIATSQVLDRDSCRYILDVMLKQELNDLLPQGLPLEVQMAHKTGSLFQLRHDAGIVYGPSGPYVITVLSWNQTDSVATYTVIPKMSAAVYKYFNSRDFQPARYFPETRQVVGPAFLLYYNSHGGPATFGLPIAPETPQGDRVVQYFERARLERPAAGGPVALGLIGRELTAAQGRAFPPTAQANPNDANTQWFAATQQAIGQPFLGYWRQHGGEEIFGLPISPVVVEDHNGQQLRVQYFERARFELHGDTVSLGLVGSEVYALRK
jgi:beta-lactamase class A